MSRWGLIDEQTEQMMRVWFPHYHRVPKDPEKNKAYRRRIVFTADKAEQRYLRKCCAEDFLFYANSFLYLFDAGDESGLSGPVPFITYDFQDEVIAALWDSMYVRRGSVRVKKPRRLGLTWICMALLEHCWHFMPHKHLLIGSHREEEVDGTAASMKMQDTGEWSKLLPKVDFLHLHQPRWLWPEGYRVRTEPYRTRMKIINPSNGSILWGTSAATVAGHGERGWASFWDEAAKTETLYDIIGGLQKFAKTKIWVSTIANLSHPFSTILKDAPGVRQLDPQWWMCPEYTEGLTIDPETGQRTSPWLRRELDEINHDQVQANALFFADETLQVGGYYSAGTFRVTVGTSDKPGTVMEPFYVGEMDVVDHKDGPRVTRFCNQPSGRWSFWFHPDSAGAPPRGTKYIFGVDTAAGTKDSGGRGASNSVIAVADWKTGEIVAEYAVSDKQPYELARIAVAAGWWFMGDDGLPALMVPESNGVGGQFIDCVVNKQRYPNVYMRDIAKLEYGWHKSGRDNSARLAFGLHQEMICDGRLKERSFECVREMRHYQYPPSGTAPPIHAAALLSDDPSGARDNHGDRVIARICICQALQRPYVVPRKHGQAPWGSYRALREARELDSEEMGPALVGGDSTWDD